MLIFKKKISLIFFFCLINYNFNLIFYFKKKNNYLIKLRIFLTFFKVITNLLNSFNIKGIRDKLQTNTIKKNY